MSLEKLTRGMITEFGKTKAYVSGASQPLLGAPFYYPIRKVTTCEPVSPYTQSREVTRPTREVRTRSRILATQEEHSKDYSNLIYSEISEVV